MGSHLASKMGFASGIWASSEERRQTYSLGSTSSEEAGAKACGGPTATAQETEEQEQILWRATTLRLSTGLVVRKYLTQTFQIEWSTVGS